MDDDMFNGNPDELVEIDIDEGKILVCWLRV